jgi:hypothetical protein
MRNLYIHIGQPKTGSSSIQRFLVENRDILRDAGLGLGPYNTQKNGKSRPLREAIRTRGLAQVMTELARDPAENVVISSEHFHDPMSERATAEAFRDAARPHFTPIIVLFLRRQDFWQHSLYAQEVKTCYAAPITRFDADYDFNYDYNTGLLQLEEIFGRENVRVAIYRDGEDNDVIGDFLDRVDALDMRERIRAIERQNTTLHRRKLMFLAGVPKPDPAVQDLSRLMTEVVKRTEAIADDGERFLMSPRQRHDLVARYLAGNRALVERHGLADPGSFTCVPPRDADWIPPRPLSRREINAVRREALATSLRHPHRRFAARMTAKVLSLYFGFRVC